MKAELVIGKALRPRGLKGEIKIEAYTPDFASTVRIDGKEYAVLKFAGEGGFGYLQLQGIDNIDQAEALRGKLIYAYRSSMPKLNEGEYYIADIVGLDVIVDGECVGKIESVQQYGAADVYTASNKKGSFSFPALKKLLLEVDLENGKMVLDKDVFKSVVVYN